MNGRTGGRLHSVPRSLAATRTALVAQGGVRNPRRRAAHGCRRGRQDILSDVMPGSPSPDFTIRPAKTADARAIGRLGALLVRLHHEFDRDRFVAASVETEHGYGSYLRSQLAKSDIVVL